MLELYPTGGAEQWLATFHFGVEVRTRYCETDALGHISNTVYPAYLEFGRLQYFINAGDPEQGPFAFSHVTAELQLRYLSPSYYDEPLRILSKLLRLGRSSATMDQAIVGSGGSIRAISRVSLVRSNGHAIAPWTSTQRERLVASMAPSSEEC